MNQNILNCIRRQEAAIPSLLFQGRPIEEIESSLSALLFARTISVRVCNENMAFYVLDEQCLYFYCLHDVQDGFRQELEREFSCLETINLLNAFIKVFKMDDRLRQRMQLPNVLLVNLHYAEKYPSYRFALGIADIAGYLRKHNLAKVTIADMQFMKKSEVVGFISAARYDFIGLSTNFGHFPLMEELIADISGTYADCKIVVGNYLAATEYRHILELHPEVLVSSGEGELTFAALCRTRIYNNQELAKVPNLYYSEDGSIHFTYQLLIEMDELPVPAFDAVEKLFSCGGVMTLEFSRGCNYGKCSFCPRKFKGLHWRGMSPPHMLKMWKRYYWLFQVYQKKPYIYFADEEFLGNCKNADIHERAKTFFQSVLFEGLHINFDISCRLDQVVDKSRSFSWSRQQVALLEQAKLVGLKRIFLGLESGSAAQLKRYNKGLDLEQAMCSLRVLSGMGFTLRLGFITFDPLMTKEDLAQNLSTISRRDVLLSARPMGDFELMAVLQQEVLPATDTRFLFEAISYPASPLELLRGCDYAYYVLSNYEELIDDSNATDYFGRLRCNYLDQDIQRLCDLCQQWVNFHFPLTYIVKGLAKRHGENEKCYQKIIWLYRYFTYALLVCLSYGLNVISETDMLAYLAALSPECPIMSETDFSNTAKTVFSIETALKSKVRGCIDELVHSTTTCPPKLIEIYDRWCGTSVLSEDTVRKN